VINASVFGPAAAPPAVAKRVVTYPSQVDLSMNAMYLFIITAFLLARRVQ
jgi:hypothetical protein